MTSRRRVLELVGVLAVGSTAVASRGATSPVETSRESSNGADPHAAIRRAFASATVEQGRLDGTPQPQSGLFVPTPEFGPADADSPAAIALELLRQLSSAELSSLAAATECHTRVRDPIADRVIERPLAVLDIAAVDTRWGFLVDGPVSEGSRLVFDGPAVAELLSIPGLSDHLQRAGAIRSPPLSGTGFESPTRAALWFKAYVPTDPEQLLPSVYPGASDPVQYNQSTDPAVVRAELAGHLDRLEERGWLTETRRDEVLSRYDDPDQRALFSDETGAFAPELMAATLSNAGTAFDSVISTVIDGENETGKPIRVRYGDASDMPPGEFARAFLVNSENRAIYELSPILKFDPFQVVGALLTHEAVHQEFEIGQPEEIIGNLFQFLAYSQQLLVDSKLATTGSGYIKLKNGRLLSMLNSGKFGYPMPGILDAPQIQNPPMVIPGGTSPAATSRDLEDLLRLAYSDDSDVPTPGNAYFRSVIKNITDLSDTELDFSDETIALIDGHLTVFSDEELFELLQILDLALPEVPDENSTAQAASQRGSAQALALPR